MLFKQVAGQFAAKKGLIHMAESGKMPHAILLLGKEGTGGLPLALAFAQYILCENKGQEDACGLCANCQKVARLEHADLHLSFPTIKIRSDKPAMSFNYIREFRHFVHETPYGTTFDFLQSIQAENKQGNLSAEECREIIDKLNLKSYEGGTKIQLIWRPEYLGKEGNILLKLIEEPPANTILLFVAENAEDILATIRSRTQMVRLVPIPASEIASALVENRLANERRAQQIGQIADGSYTEALRLLEHVENDLLPVVRSLFNSVFTNNATGLVQFTDEWAKEGREGIKNLFAYTLTLLEAALRTTFVPDTVRHFVEEEAEFIKKLASRKMKVEIYDEMIKALTDAQYQIERNAHSKSVIMAMCLKLRRTASQATQRV